MYELPHELPNDLRGKIVDCTEMNFSFNDFFSKCEQNFTFTKEILLNWKLSFLCTNIECKNSKGGFFCILFSRIQTEQRPSI